MSDKFRAAFARRRLWKGASSARFRANFGRDFAYDDGQMPAISVREWRKKSCWNFPVS